MDLFQSDRKRQRISLEEGGVGGLMDSNNCLQYRVTGGANGGGGGGAGANNSSGAGDAPYRGVPSSNGDNNANTNTNGPSNSSALSNAVLASPINGQFYVIGNPSDVFGGAGQRNIAPRTGPFSMDTVSSLSSPNSKEDKLGTRRATHNEVERRRRDNINNWIMKLSKLIPDCNGGDTNSMSSSGPGKQSQSKGGILAKACEYLAEMRNTNQRLVDSIKQAEEVTADNERLSLQVEQLQQENAVLKQQLQNHGIVPQTSQDIKFQI